MKDRDDFIEQLQQLIAEYRDTLYTRVIVAAENKEQDELIGDIVDELGSLDDLEDKLGEL